MKSVNKIKLLNGEIKDIDKVYSMGISEYWKKGDISDIIFEGDVFTFKDNKVYVDIFFRESNYVECVSRFKLVNGCLNFTKDHIVDDFIRNLGNVDSTEDCVTLKKEEENLVNIEDYYNNNLLYIGNIHFDGMEVITKKLIEINKDDVDK